MKEILPALPRVCRYEDLNKQTQRIIEGLNYKDLPKDLVLDPELTDLFDSNRSVVGEHLRRLQVDTTRADTHKKLIKMYEQKLLEYPNDFDAQIGLHHQKVSLVEEENQEHLEHEFSQNLYLVDDEVLRGKAKGGFIDSVNVNFQGDGMDKKDLLVNIHNHRILMPFSRIDISTMIYHASKTTKKCLNFLAAPEHDLVAVFTADTPKLKKNDEKYLDGKEVAGKTYAQKTVEIEEKLPANIDSRMRHFTADFLQVLELASKYKFGIYTRPKTGGTFQRVNLLEDILNFYQVGRA